jgi:hypothetical protein
MAATLATAAVRTVATAAVQMLMSAVTSLLLQLLPVVLLLLLLLLQMTEMKQQQQQQLQHLTALVLPARVLPLLQTVTQSEYVCYLYMICCITAELLYCGDWRTDSTSNVVACCLAACRVCVVSATAAHRTTAMLQ